MFLSYASYFILFFFWFFFFFLLFLAEKNYIFFSGITAMQTGSKCQIWRERQHHSESPWVSCSQPALSAACTTPALYMGCSGGSIERLFG